MTDHPLALLCFGLFTACALCAFGYWIWRQVKAEQQAEAALRDRILNDPVMTAANNQHKAASKEEKQCSA